MSHFKFYSAHLYGKMKMYSCNINPGQKFNFIALQIKITHPINLVFSFKDGGISE